LVPSSDDWQEFEGTSEARSLLGGAGNVDDPSSGRRERALSSDAGKTWEVNWVMEFTRQARPSRTDRDATRSIRQFPGFVIVRGRRQATIEGERVVRR
jgi:hypothetical protein